MKERERREGRRKGRRKGHVSKYWWACQLKQSPSEMLELRSSLLSGMYMETVTD